MIEQKRRSMVLRTKRFALDVIHLYSALPKSTVAQVLGKQVLRSATSVGAHYREACRAKSGADFVSKIEGGLQELDETGYWLELLQDAKVVEADQIKPLVAETNELLSVFVSVVKSVKFRVRA
jgi:four helix bundle protein